MSYLRSRTYNCVRERPRRRAAFDLFVLKDISADDLVSCNRDVLAGKTYLARAAAKLAEGVTRVQLTPRDMATLGLLADGKANKEIASDLDISERTVKTHLAHLFEKPRPGTPRLTAVSRLRRARPFWRELRRASPTHLTYLTYPTYPTHLTYPP